MKKKITFYFVGGGSLTFRNKPEGFYEEIAAHVMNGSGWTGTDDKVTGKMVDRMNRDNISFFVISDDYLVEIDVWVWLENIMQIVAVITMIKLIMSL